MIDQLIFQRLISRRVPFEDSTFGEFEGWGRFCHVFYPKGKAGEPQIRRCQGLAVPHSCGTASPLAPWL